MLTYDYERVQSRPRGLPGPRRLPIDAAGIRPEAKVFGTIPVSVGADNVSAARRPSLSDPAREDTRYGKINAGRCYGWTGG